MAPTTKDAPAAPAPQAMTPGEPRVLLEWRGPVALLTLSNPPLNILTTDLLTELRSHVLELTKDRRTRALVITGAGDRAFSGGANVREMLPMSRAESARHSAMGQGIFNLLERAPFPVIAAVRGFCLGGGCEMVQACDFVLASDDAQFGQPEINIGVIPGWGGSTRLPRIIGPARARRWIMTGARVSAAQAFEDGLVDRVVPAGALLDQALELGSSLAAKSAEALAAAKYLVNHATDPDRLSGLEYERNMWGRLFETAGQQEGMRAFLEKRPTAFPPERIPSPGPRFPWDAPATSSTQRARPRSGARSRKRPSGRTKVRGAHRPK